MPHDDESHSVEAGEGGQGAQGAQGAQDGRERGGCGAGGWARRWWRALLAEALATALLVLLGVGSLLPLDGAAPPLTHAALAFGFVVTANVQAFGAASGAHMNPAVSLAALLLGRLPAAAAAAYAAAQLLGAVLGFAALRALAPRGAFSRGPAGCTLPGPGTAPPAAAAVEALLTGTLVLVASGLWAAHDPRRPDTAAPLKLGVVVAGLVYAGGPLTGASLNPARSLGPALLLGEWRHHWVYWCGPLGGAALAALLHRWLLRPRPARAAPARLPEQLPLRDKRDC